jgi:alpha-galactosidase
MRRTYLCILLLVAGLLIHDGVLAQKFDGLARTPPMGWNSWNKFQCNVDEQMIRETVDVMVSSGMKEA